jgi:endo-1,4-beta-xylanase
MARDIFPPETKLMINEYNILSSDVNVTRYLEIIDLLQAEDLIDVIGVQGHAFSTRGSAEAMTQRLDRLGATGLSIQVTEMDVDGNPNQIDMTPEQSDAVQLSAMQRIFPTLWAHPSVEGITIWGWRPGLWRTPQEAYLVRAITRSVPLYSSCATTSLHGRLLPRPKNSRANSA